MVPSPASIPSCNAFNVLGGFVDVFEGGKKRSFRVFECLGEFGDILNRPDQLFGGFFHLKLVQNVAYRLFGL